MLAQLHEWQVGQGGQDGGEGKGDPAPGAPDCDGGFRTAPEVAEPGQRQNGLEDPQQDQDETAKTDEGADLLPEPDLVSGRQGMALALQPRLHPVDDGHHASGGEVLPGMGDAGKVKAAGGPQGGIAVHPAGLHSRRDAKDLLQLGRVGQVGSLGRAPHEAGELIQPSEDHVQVAREIRADLGRGPEEPRGGAHQRHGAVAVGLSMSCREDRAAAHAVARQADLLSINEGLAAQEGEGRRAPEAGGAHIAARAAVPGHVHRQDDETPPRELDGEGALHLPGIDVAVAEEDRRRAPRPVQASGPVEQARHCCTLGCAPVGFTDLNAASGLNPRGQE